MIKMTKKTITVLIFILTCWSASAQISNSPNSISLSFGPAFPIGSYGNKELKSSSTGFAKTGTALNISFSHQINKTWGLSFTAFGQRNNYDTKAMEDAFSNKKLYHPIAYSGTYPPPNPTYSIYPNWEFTKDEWWIGGLMAGGFMQFPSRFSQDFQFTIKAQLGAVYVESPETKGVSSTDTGMASFSQNGSHGIGFSYTIGAGAQYKLSKKLYWITNLDFLGTNKMLFKDIVNTTTIINNPSNPVMGSFYQFGSNGSGKQSIQSINFTVGLGFIL